MKMVEDLKSEMWSSFGIPLLLSAPVYSKLLKYIIQN